MSDRDHRGCVVDQRQEAEAARRALLHHETVAGASLTSPREDPTDAWAIELAILTGPEHRTDGLEPRHLGTPRCHGLTVRAAEPRSPREFRVVLTL
jgi:hypothetical protein